MAERKTSRTTSMYEYHITLSRHCRNNFDNFEWSRCTCPWKWGHKAVNIRVNIRSPTKRAGVATPTTHLLVTLLILTRILRFVPPMFSLRAMNREEPWHTLGLHKFAMVLLAVSFLWATFIAVSLLWEAGFRSLLQYGKQMKFYVIKWLDWNLMQDL